jgi:hypothetical protein
MKASLYTPSIRLVVLSPNSPLGNPTPCSKQLLTRPSPSFPPQGQASRITTAIKCTHVPPHLLKSTTARPGRYLFILTQYPLPIHTSTCPNQPHSLPPPHILPDHLRISLETPAMYFKHQITAQTPNFTVHRENRHQTHIIRMPTVHILTRTYKYPH